MMASYIDGNLELSETLALIKGVPGLPIFRIQFSPGELESVEEIELSLFNRCCLMGSQDFKRWWPIDLRRPFKKKGIVLRIKDFPFDIALTPLDCKSALRALKPFLISGKGG